MRIDKWLWCTRIFKTRTLATESCKAGLVKIAGRRAKPSAEIQPGEEIQVTKEGILRSFKVLALLDKRLGAKLIPAYLEETTPEEVFEQYRESRQEAHRDPGMGRPTKRDRREFDKFFG
jgi:ribosome-associated heat shock protein Hsp15